MNEKAVSGSWAFTAETLRRIEHMLPGTASDQAGPLEDDLNKLERRVESRELSFRGSQCRKNSTYGAMRVPGQDLIEGFWQSIVEHPETIAKRAHKENQ